MKRNGFDFYGRVSLLTQPQATLTTETLLYLQSYTDPPRFSD